MSLSRFVGELLERTMRESREYEGAMRRNFEARPTELTKRGSRSPTHAELYE